MIINNYIIILFYFYIKIYLFVCIISSSFFLILIIAIVVVLLFHFLLLSFLFLPFPSLPSILAFPEFPPVPPARFLALIDLFLFIFQSLDFFTFLRIFSGYVLQFLLLCGILFEKIFNLSQKIVYLFFLYSYLFTYLFL